MNFRLLKLPSNKQGIAIDAIVILLNLVLFPFISGRIKGLFVVSFGDKQPEFKTLGTLMVIIIIGRLGGLYLKRFPLQYRMRSSEASFSIYFLVFHVPIMVLTAAFGIVLLQYLAADLGFMETGYNGLPKESQAMSMAAVFLILILSAVEIYLMYRLGKPLNAKEEQKAAKGNWMFGFKGEFLADFGLFVYMMVWQVFYFLTADLLLTPPEGASWGWDMQIFSFFFLLVCFTLFYVSPRAIFLTEDRKYPATWAMIFLVFLTSLIAH
jgi:hypothetical protein